MKADLAAALLLLVAEIAVPVVELFGVGETGLLGRAV